MMRHIPAANLFATFPVNNAIYTGSGVYDILTYDHPNGFTYLQQGRDYINLFLFKYMAF